VEHEAPRPSVDGGADGGVAELDLRGVHRRLVRADRLLGALDGGLIGADGLLCAIDIGLVGEHGVRERLRGGAELVGLLLGDQAPLEELRVPARLDLRVLRLRLIARERRPRLAHLRTIAVEGRPCLLDLAHVLGEVRLGLRQRRLEGARVDGEEEVPRAHVLAFLEVHAHQLAADLGLDRDHGVGFHGADRLDLEGDGLLLDGGDGDGHGKRLWRLFRLGLVARAASEGRGERGRRRQSKADAKCPHEAVSRERGMAQPLIAGEAGSPVQPRAPSVVSGTAAVRPRPRLTAKRSRSR